MLTPLQLVRRSIGLLVGLGAFSCALTLLYLASSSVMGIGGSCGSGGPYVIATPCPTGIAWIVPVSILGGLVALGVYAASLLPVGPRLTSLAWPALFLSLGYAFLDSSLDPETGVDWSFMVCAVLFILMGGVPLLFLANRGTFRQVFWGTAPPPPAVSGPGPGNVRWTTTVELPGDRDRNRDRVRNRPLAPVTPEPAGGSGLVGELERLAALHRAGQLDDAEYSAAKKRLLNGSH
ncbi:SHOCT domain-containing protein [Planotetraspora sp. A-T 1434]|uniref:SHOCT domain-containing protein n=1 Tax=Planotetraspora sp. A-T 1434 TaxID=2979219 RepID=UPI0021C056E7|nr:SHOCT domain-containing protein [Planotetraspora sp. A-T 1434]MCT9933878.1 SHOCT domain-containing protein [Planotetraspora sp. A-T 1434]